MAATKDFDIRKGDTFSKTLRMESAPFVYRKIVSISKSAPVRIVTEDPHDLPDGWRVAVVSAKGSTEINAKNNPPRDTDYHKATVIDANTIELNDINSLDYGNHTANTGALQYLTPTDLGGYTGVMRVWDKDTKNNLLASSNASDAPKDIITVDIDDTAKTVTVTIADSDTDDINWKSGYYELDLNSGSATTTVLLGNLKVTA